METLRTIEQTRYGRTGRLARRSLFPPPEDEDDVEHLDYSA
jgi:hypothetical protein